MCGSGGVGLEPKLAFPPKATRSGRNISLLSKFRYYNFVALILCTISESCVQFSLVVVEKQFTEAGSWFWCSRAYGAGARTVAVHVKPRPCLSATAPVHILGSSAWYLDAQLLLFHTASPQFDPDSDFTCNHRKMILGICVPHACHPPISYRISLTLRRSEL
jgi:hypothetical protein